MAAFATDDGRGRLRCDGLRRCLDAKGVTTVADLGARYAGELLEIRGLGEKGVQEHRASLAAFAL
jgi:DNA-directed RNA polymerase alpha subunit